MNPQTITASGTSHTPGPWAHPGDEFSTYPQGDHTWEQAALDAATAAQQRRAWIATAWIFTLLTALAYIALVQAAGFDFGPAAGQTAACKAAGGHETDLVLAHHCEIDN